MEESNRPPRSRLALCALMIITGLLHLVIPDPYTGIVPRLLPAGWARGLVYVSGIAQIGCGLALIPLRSRRPAGWFLMGLLVLLFPANVQAALNTPNALTIGRLPLQGPLVWWAWRQTR